MRETSLNDTRMVEHREHIRAHVCTVKCVSWSAIVMGAIIAISLSFLLNLLALAVGFSAFPAGANGQIAFGVGGFIGLVVCSFLAMFPAGWIAGYLGRSHCLRRKTGELYGLATWGLAGIISMALASSVGGFLAQSNYLVARNDMPMKFATATNAMVYEPAKKVEAAADLSTTHVDTTTLGMVTFVTFFVFFIGAIAACFGGKLGMTYRRGTMMANHLCHHCSCPH